MQTKTASPRSSFTSSQVDEALAFRKGAMTRWGVDIYDAAGVLRTTVATTFNNSGEWQAGQLFGLITSGTALRRV